MFKTKTKNKQTNKQKTKQNQKHKNVVLKDTRHCTSTWLIFIIFFHITTCTKMI